MARHKSRRKRKRSSSTSSSSSSTGGNENVARGRQRRQKVSSTPVGSASLTTQSYNVQPVSNIIPEFDPKLKDIEDWIEIIQYNANIYQWSDSTITFQALSKLQGTAKMWYDSYIESELGWSQFAWERWKGILVATFKSNRDCYKLFMDLVNHKPANGCALYDFYFEHLSKINKLKLNFSESDKVSLIVGAINDSNITAAVEASNMSDLNALGSYLKNKIHSISATEAPQKHKSEITFNRPSTSGIRHSIASHIANRETICKTCGKTGHHRALCRHRNQICNYCKVKGHIESYCLNKNNQRTHDLQSKPERHKNKSFTKQKNVNAIENSNNTSKFHKDILLNGNHCKAFVDFGSECSLVKSSVVDNFNFQTYDLENIITLSGFLGSGTTVTQYVRASTQIDSVVLDIEYYIVKDIEFKFDILIGRNFTENSSTNDALLGTNDALLGTNDALLGTNDALLGTNEALLGTNDALLGTNEALLGTNDALLGTNDALLGTNEALLGTNDALLGTNEALLGTNEALLGTNDALLGTNEALSGTNEALSGTIDAFLGDNKMISFEDERRSGWPCGMRRTTTKCSGYPRVDLTAPVTRE
nr:unnamed protein product [Callosobruchus chinensis]